MHSVRTRKGVDDFSVAVLGGVEIEEVVDERAFEPSPLSFIDDEAAAGNFGRGVQIEQTEFLAEFPMGLRLKCEFRRFADDALDAVVLRRSADGNGIVIDVGDAQEGVGQFGIDLGESLIELSDLVSDSFHLGRGFGGVTSLGFDGTDFLAGAIAFAFQRFDFLDVFAALFVQIQNLGDQFFIAGVAARDFFPV